MADELAKYKQQIEILQQENQVLKSNQAKFSLLNDLFTDMLNVHDLKGIYCYIAANLQRRYPDTIVMFVSINEHMGETCLECVEGIENELIKKIFTISGFNPIGKKFKLLPKHNDYFKTGRLVEFKGGLAEFSASEFPNVIAQSIEKLIGLSKIHTIGIVKDGKLLAAIHFLSHSKTTVLDSLFIEMFVKQAGAIMQKKIAEMELQESEERFKNMFENHNAVMLLIDPVSRLIIDANEAALKFYGFSKSVLCAMKIDDINSSSIGFNTDESNSEMNNQSDYSICQHKLSNSEIRIVETYSSLIDYQKSKILFSVIHDITERRLIEKALETSEKRNSAFLNTLPDMMFIHNSEGLFVNVYLPEESAQFVSSHDLIGKNVRNVVPTTVADKFFPVLQKAIHSKKMQLFEFSLQLPDKLHFYEARSISYETDNVLTIVRDITKRHLNEQTIKQQNIKLEKLIADKDQFLSILAHDLRTPFCSLLGFSDRLLVNIRKYDIEKIESQLKIIRQISSQTYNLLEDLLLWSKSKSGKLPFDPKRTDLQEILFDVMTTFEANSKNIKINSFQAEYIEVKVDKEMVKTVLRNLISNALKFTDKNGQIMIYAQKEINNVTITVSDNGVGIEKEQLLKLWDFAKLYSTKGTDNESGTGFGLSLCKEFVEKHGGEIWAESELDKGSDFKFTLPLYLK